MVPQLQAGQYGPAAYSVRRSLAEPSRRMRVSRWMRRRRIRITGSVSAAATGLDLESAAGCLSLF